MFDRWTWSWVNRGPAKPPGKPKPKPPGKPKQKPPGPKIVPIIPDEPVKHDPSYYGQAYVEPAKFFEPDKVAEDTSDTYLRYMKRRHN